MQKVIVIGCPGSGKSTFSKVFANKTGLPLVHLDLLYWNADKTTVSKELFLERLCDVLTQDQWIIDGNYESTMELRIHACDTVFFLDYPVEVCFDGIQERKGRPRTDMPWIENPDDIDGEFIDFIKNYNVKSKPKVVSLLQKHKDKNVIVFKSREESENFLAHI